MTSSKTLVFTKMQYKEKFLEIDGVIENSKFTYLHVSDLDQTSYVGNVYVAKVINIVPTIQGAFVKFREDEKAFLPLDPRDHFLYTKKVGNPDKLNQGDEILIQIIADPLKTKDAKASADISLQTDHVVLTTGNPKKGASKKLPYTERVRLKEFLEAYQEEPFGIILRTNCNGCDTDVLREEISELKSQYESLLTKGQHAVCYSHLYSETSHRISLLKHYSGISDEISVLTDQENIYQEVLDYIDGHKHYLDLKDRVTLYQDSPNLFKLYSVSECLDKLLQKRAWMKHGGYLVIEETEAMNVVDVNSGKDTRKKPRPDEVLRINKEAADKLMEQMRLRELSGMILVDFINMSSEEHREELLSYMKGRCKEDFNKVRIVDYTKLGLVEITREKKFPSLKQLLT